MLAQADKAAQRLTNVLRQIQPARTASARQLRLIYGLWFLAFLLKHAGASWDIAWHFQYVRDDFIPPHLTNIIGTSLALALLIYQTWTGLGVHRPSLVLLQFSVVLYCIAGPLDFLNHRLYGLDITTWSMTHFLIYVSTTLMLVGVLRSWRRLAPKERLQLALSLGIWTLLMDDVMFPLGQQEYGVLVIDAYLKGHTTASPELLAMAGTKVVSYIQGGLPEWLYPVWMILSTTVVLTLARQTTGWRWAATAAAGLYLAYRFAAYAVLAAAGFPPSFIPVMLIGGGLAVDLATRWRWPSGVAALAIVGVYYLSAVVIGRLTLMPAFPLETAPAVFIALWAGLAAMHWWQRKAVTPETWTRWGLGYGSDRGND